MVDSVDTYNGAGLKGWDEIWNTYIAGSVSGGTLDKNRVTNYYADKGVELTADQDLWFNRPGGRQDRWTMRRRCVRLPCKRISRSLP